MPRMTIEIPDVVYNRLTKYQTEKKPHLSLKDVIIEAVDTVLDDYERDYSGTQVNMPETPEEREALIERSGLR